MGSSDWSSDVGSSELCATARAGNRDIEPDNADVPLIAGAVREGGIELAQAVVRDGEGATRFITIKVSEATSRAEARQIAYAIANSPLVKTAMFAGDANWGRIVMAIGKAGVAGLDPAGVENGRAHV